MTSINSTDDQRVENSPVRHQYRILSESEKQQVSHIKDLAKELVDYLSLFENPSFDLVQAIHYAKLSSMLAVSHVTK